MSKWFDKLNIYLKCSVLSAIFFLLTNIGFIPCYVVKEIALPLGMNLGVIVGILVYIVTGTLEQKFPKGHKWVIVINVCRFLLFAGILILLAICYYRLGIKLFNLFTYVGGYLVVLLFLLTLYFDEYKKGRINGGNI